LGFRGGAGGHISNSGVTAALAETDK